MSPQELDALIKNAVKIHKENSNFRYSAFMGESILITILRRFEELLSVTFFRADHGIIVGLGDATETQRKIFNAMEEDGKLLSPNPFMKTVRRKTVFEYNNETDIDDPALIDEITVAFITAIKAVFAAKHLMLDEGETNDEIINLRDAAVEKKRKELERGPERKGPPIEKSPSDPSFEPLEESSEESSEGGNEATADKNRPSKNVMKEVFDNFVRQNYDYKKGNDQKQKQLNYALVKLHFGDPPNYDAFWKSLPSSTIYKRSADVRQILATKLKCNVVVEIPAAVPETEPIETPITVPPPVPPPLDPPLPPEKKANRYLKNIRANKSCFRIVIAEDPPPGPPPGPPVDPDDPFGYKTIIEKVENLPEEAPEEPTGPTSSVELQEVTFYNAGNMEFVCNQAEIKNLMKNLMNAVDAEVRRNPYENIFGLDFLISGMNILNSLPPARQKGRLI
jgi:hypothetical protein